MNSIMSLQTCNLHVKTPVVVVFADSNVAPPSQPSNVIPFIRRLFSRRSEANHPHRSIHIAVVSYDRGNSSSPSSHVSMNTFALVDVHNEPTMLPECHPISGFCSGTPALDGYVFAMKMIDLFKMSKQNPEEFSYYILHITTAQDDHSACWYSGFLFWNRLLGDIPEELQRNNVTQLTIRIRPQLAFSALATATPPETMKRPHCETGLSSLEAHDPNPGVVPSTVLAKRPADTPVEHRSQRQKIEETPQAITGSLSSSANPSAVPCRPPITYTTQAVPQVTAPDSAIQPPSCEAKCTISEKPVWLGNLMWHHGRSEIEVPVQATYPIRDLRTSEWPQTLRIEIIETEMSPLDMQTRIQKYKSPVIRFQCLPGIDNQHFGDLVKTLRKDKCVAVVKLEIEIQVKNSLTSYLVLAPLHESLFCAAFPTSDIPKANLQQPQQEVRVKMDYASPASSPSPFENVTESLPEEDLNNNRTDAFASTGTLVQSVSQQEFQLQQSLAYAQGQLQQLHFQPDVHHAPLVAHVPQADVLVPCGSEALITVENGAGTGFDLTHPHPNHWGMSTELYYGGMDGMPHMWADGGQP